jgi:hypothetical protein
MKLTALVAALAALVILTGCDATGPALLSLEPVATAKDNAIDGAFFGTWEEQGDNGLLAIVRPADQGGYQIAVLSGTSVIGFQAKLFYVNKIEFLDLAPSDDNDFRIPGHAVVRVWIDGMALRWAFLDTDWLKQQASALVAHTGDGKMQLFSPTDAVRAFIGAYGIDDKAYGKVATWQKVP